MRSELKRTHEEFDFSNAVCDTEAKLPQEVLELRLREGSPETQRGIWSTCNRLPVGTDCTARAVGSPVDESNTLVLS